MGQLVAERRRCGRVRAISMVGREKGAGEGALRDRDLAERAGFEPANELPHYTLSRRACSTTPAPLREVGRHRWVASRWGGEAGVRGGVRQGVCLSDSMAERAGFEPAKLAFTRFRDERLQPLGHLSTRDSTRAVRVAARRRGPGSWGAELLARLAPRFWVSCSSWSASYPPDHRAFDASCGSLLLRDPPPP